MKKSIYVLAAAAAVLVVLSAVSFAGQLLYPGQSMEIGEGLYLSNQGHRAVDVQQVDRNTVRFFHQPPRDREFTISINNAGAIRCDDVSRGGRPGSRVVQCVDRGTGRNHGCRQLGDYGCEAWEGRGNGGGAACDARCSRW